MIESNSNTTELESDVLYYFSQLSRDNQYRAIEYMTQTSHFKKCLCTLKNQ